MSIIVGIDPGGRSTGIAVRDGRELLGAAVVDAEGPADGLPDVAYLQRIFSTIAGLHEGLDVSFAVESVVAPSWYINGRQSPMRPATLIAVSAVAGALLAHLPDVTLVRPNRNGSRPLTTYPAGLVGAREKAGGGHLRHARSAWDIAGAVTAARRAA